MPCIYFFNFCLFIYLFVFETKSHMQLLNGPVLVMQTQLASDSKSSFHLLPALECQDQSYVPVQVNVFIFLKGALLDLLWLNSLIFERVCSQLLAGSIRYKDISCQQRVVPKNKTQFKIWKQSSLKKTLTQLLGSIGTSSKNGISSKNMNISLFFSLCDVWHNISFFQKTFTCVFTVTKQTLILKHKIFFFL